MEKFISVRSHTHKYKENFRIENFNDLQGKSNSSMIQLEPLLLKLYLKFLFISKLRIKILCSIQYFQYSCIIYQIVILLHMCIIPESEPESSHSLSMTAVNEKHKIFSNLFFLYFFLCIEIVLHWTAEKSHKHKL